MFVKICGLTTEEDALLAVAMGADALGFNFVNGSKRQITPTKARDIVRRLPAGVMSVGIFRNELRDRVVQLIDQAQLQTAQLHGRESAEDSVWISERVPTVIKVFDAQDPALERADQYGATAIMVDAPEPGSGEVFDWSAVDGRHLPLPLILAGGLRPDNVARAIATVHPWGVDVATGVESSPGRKDAHLMRDFVANARMAAGELSPDTGQGSDPDDLDGPRPYDWREE